MDNIDHRALALVAHSLRVIKDNQAQSGGFVACPSFEQYQFCWYRDGAFTAHAMSVMGEADSARRFHDWASSTVIANAANAHDCITRARQSEPIDPRRILRTRYALTDAGAEDDWPNFQLDGFGTWLWSALDHTRRTGDAAAEARWRPALDLVAEYLIALWRLPNHDCWEEFGDRINSTTLLAIHGGLRSYCEAYPGSDLGERATCVAGDIRAFVLRRGVCDGHLRKFADAGCEVDAALIGAAAPYRLFELRDPMMVATVDRIERDLHLGGVHRYATDSYYGGGAWVLLTAWLGWHHALAGDRESAKRCLGWIVDQAGERLDLPEQVPVHLFAPEKRAEWLTRWGEVAKPLLWSHAQFLIL